MGEFRKALLERILLDADAVASVAGFVNEDIISIRDKWSPTIIGTTLTREKVPLSNEQYLHLAETSDFHFGFGGEREAKQ